METPYTYYITRRRGTFQKETERNALKQRSKNTTAAPGFLFCFFSLLEPHSGSRLSADEPCSAKAVLAAGASACSRGSASPLHQRTRRQDASPSFL